MREMLRIVAHFFLIFLPVSLVFASSGGGGEAPRAQSLFSGNPLGGAFYENRGQIADADGEATPDIKYYAFYNGARVYFTPQGWHTVYTAGQKDEGVSEATGTPMNQPLPDPPTMPGDRLPNQETRLYRLDMAFIGCNTDVEIEATGKLTRYLNYYLGHCPDGITKVPGFGGLRYKNLYDNIDLVLLASKDGLKYEFEVRPGGSVEDIRMRHDGQDGIECMADGSLRLHWPKGYTQEGQPFSYQESADGLLTVPSQYVTEVDDVRFSVQDYDAARTLVIDPWSTYYGGTMGSEGADDVTCDNQDAIIVAGGTSSADFPVYRASRSVFWALGDAFMVKFDTLGQVSWATFFGGRVNRYQAGSSDDALGVTTDDLGNIFLCGTTHSIDFPVSSNPYQSSLNGWEDGFLAKFDSGGFRIWATYIGGYSPSNSSEFLKDIDTDSIGNVYAVGRTDCSDFPVLNGYQSNFGGPGSSGLDAVLLKMNGAGMLLFSSFFGGDQQDEGVGIAVDSAGNFAISGKTGSGNFPTLNARQSVSGGKTDAFVAYFNSSGVPQWSTFHGGSEGEYGNSVAFDVAGNILLAGSTSSLNFPVLNAWQGVRNGPGDATVSKFDRQGIMLWSTYFGGSGGERVNAVTADCDGNVYSGGYTNSTDFPTMYAAYPSSRDSSLSGVYSGEAFVIKLDSSGNRIWSTYLGGNAHEELEGIANDGKGRTYVVGRTNSSDFPVFNAVQSVIPGYNPVYRSEYACFITLITPSGQIPITLSRLAAQRVSGGVKLTWRTESEVNAYGFIIERRYEQEAGATNSIWKDIGFVPSIAQGSEGRDYTYLDLDPGTTDPRIFYRLRKVDLDGTFEHSPVVEVGPEHSAMALTFEAAYPAPARDWLTLNFTLPVEGGVSLSVYDVTGREIARVYDGQTLASGAHCIVLPVGEWRSGLYLCTLVASETRMVRKVMVVR